MMLPSLPLQLLEDVTLFLPMDPAGIRELRSVSKITAQLFTDANLKNFTLDVDPMALMALDRFSEQIDAWCGRIQRARAIRHLDVTLACRSYPATSVMVALYHLLGVTIAVCQTPQAPLRSNLSWRCDLRRTEPMHRTVVMGRYRLKGDRGFDGEGDGDGKAKTAEKGHAGEAVSKGKTDGVMGVLLRLRLADTGRDTFSGHALRHLLTSKATVFPALEHLTVVLRTWHASNAALDARGPMTDLAQRFPRLSNLCLCGTRWDSWVWESTIRDIAKGPATLKSIRLCFRADAEEAVLASLALALASGAFVGLEEINLRSTLDVYDILYDKRGDDFNIGGAGSGDVRLGRAGSDEDGGGKVGAEVDSSVIYSNDMTFHAFGQGLGKLAPSLRRLEVRLHADSSEHCESLWTEMSSAAEPDGKMSKLARVAVHMCPTGLSGLAESIERGGLPALASLEVAHPGGPCIAAAAAAAAAAVVGAGDGGARQQPLQKLDDQFDQLRLMGSMLPGTPVPPSPLYAWNSALSRVVSSLFARQEDGTVAATAARGLHTVSLDLGPSGCRGGGIQEVIAALLVSGACPRLRRLWLFPWSALEEGTVGLKDNNCAVSGGSDGSSRGGGPTEEEQMASVENGRESRPEKGTTYRPAAVQTQESSVLVTATPCNTAVEAPRNHRNRLLPHARQQPQTTALCGELLLALTSPLCPSPVAEAFADRGPLSLRIPRLDRWWGA